MKYTAALFGEYDEKGQRAIETLSLEADHLDVVHNTGSITLMDVDKKILGVLNGVKYILPVL